MGGPVESAKAFLGSIEWSKCRKKRPPTDRTVHANDPARNTAQEFVSNRISNTKYTMWSFLPKTLLEQFSRNMNRYFLLIACLQLIKDITPVNPLTTWLPLIVIFGITAIKELTDDLGRRKADVAANSREYTVVREGKQQKLASENIMVGDIVRLTENEEIPCDLVLLSCSDPLGNCFIQTTNLDGESNLKTRTAPAATRGLVTEAQLSAFKGVIKCGPPDEKLYKFDSQLRVEAGGVVALSSDQLMLQATHLRNTDFVFGMVVYTGNETKFGNNKKSPPPKLTKADKIIDRFSAYIFILQLVLVIIFGIVGDVIRQKMRGDAGYLQFEPKFGVEALVIPARFLLLNSTMIPISLKVTLDLCKLCYSKFINHDIQLYDEVSDTPAHSNSTALSEDLGQVEYVLTDKTGTLTENIMSLKVCTIGGVQYGTFSASGNLLSGEVKARGPVVGGVLQDPRMVSALESGNQAAINFYRCMAVNNSVVPSVHEDGTRTYKASSPDEEALVQAADSYHVSMMSREGSIVVINVLGKTERYELEEEFEFTSDRKRMSVVVRNLDSGERTVFVKGADDMVLRLLAAGQEVQKTAQQVDAFAESGLRTLVLGYKRLSEPEYRAWKVKFDEASAAMVDRQAKKEVCYDLLEKDFILIGATAIEDRLQRGVPETIAILSKAGCRFWMCTGDKFSTALTISQTCNLKPKSNVLITLDGKDSAEIGRSIAAGIAETKGRPQPYTVIVRGDTLEIAFVDHLGPLCTLMMGAMSAVCCRVTPKQKAQLVKVVKDAGHMTLAIGDGGNDVSMIQEAHVGVGIRGKEGLQASRAADYVVAPFMSLQRLLLIHGRYSYYRTSLVAQYSFYKSFLFCFLQLGYSFVSGFSGVSMFNSLCVAAYNALLFVPVVFFFVDKDLSETFLTTFPQAYATTRMGVIMNNRTMFWWFLRALVQSIIVLSVGLSLAPSTRSDAYEVLGLLIFNGYLLLQDLTMLLELRTVTVFNVVSIFSLHLTAIITLIIINLIMAFLSFVDYWSFNVTLADPAFWFGGLVIALAALVPIEAAKAYAFNFVASKERLCRWIDITNDYTPGFEVPAAAPSDRKASIVEPSENGVPADLERRNSQFAFANPIPATMGAAGRTGSKGSF